MMSMLQKNNAQLFCVGNPPPPPTKTPPQPMLKKKVHLLLKIDNLKHLSKKKRGLSKKPLYKQFTYNSTRPPPWLFLDIVNAR